jgi:hypothetical protein
VTAVVGYRVGSAAFNSDISLPARRKNVHKMLIHSTLKGKVGRHNTIYRGDILVNSSMKGLMSLRHPTNMATEMETRCSDAALLHNSSLYREFLAEKDEILRHKWIESEKAGRDIGFEAALVDWITKHRAGWRRARQNVRSN